MSKGRLLYWIKPNREDQMEKRIKIDGNISTYIEKLFFEYKAVMNILRYLTSQDGVKRKYLDGYFKDAKNKYMELELAKKEVSDKYRPQNMCIERYNFDFDNCEIVYIGGERND